MEYIKRTRNWATIVYPSSAKEDWISTLSSLLVPALISPLHSEDKDEKGELLKQHYHVAILFDSVKTAKQAREIFDLIGGVGTVAIQSMRTYARYLCHLDNPEKAQYSVNDVICCSGADYHSIIELPSDKYTVISEIIDYCVIHSIDSYVQLLIYAKENNYSWFKILIDHSVPMVQIMKSLSWEKTRHQ